MSKWKCGICNSEFDNYQAQGFNGVIYCPLCYFKELYKREEQENKRLKERIAYLERSNNRREDTILGLRQEVAEQEDYKTRCEKAIKYLYNSDMFINRRDLLNILQGSDK